MFQTTILERADRVRLAFDSQDSAISNFTVDGNVEAPAVTLDDFATQQSIGDVDRLKIESETYEAQVLRGARSVLARTRYLLIVITSRATRITRSHR